jgi:hypothetical protein
MEADCVEQTKETHLMDFFEGNFESTAIDELGMCTVIPPTPQNIALGFSS